MKKSVQKMFVEHNGNHCGGQYRIKKLVNIVSVLVMEGRPASIDDWITKPDVQLVIDSEVEVIITEKN